MLNLKHKELTAKSYFWTEEDKKMDNVYILEQIVLKTF